MQSELKGWKEVRERPPEIRILRGVESAAEAVGLVVVIDVFRVFSFECYLFERGAADVIPVGDIEIARRLKSENPEIILAGERKGRIQPGFDVGNSPWDLNKLDLKGKTVVHTTSAGTQGLAGATRADQLVTGSFVNAGATARYISSQGAERVTLLCTNPGSLPVPDDEDALCASYLKGLLEKSGDSFEEVARSLRESRAVRHFLDPKITSHPEQDLDMCLDLDRFNFVLRAELHPDGLLHLARIDVP